MNGAYANSSLRVRRRLSFTGTVQGVGFRPYVATLARSFGLSGSVGNDFSGAWCEVEGEQISVDKFQEQLPLRLPPLAQITRMSVDEQELESNSDGFEIVDSVFERPIQSSIPVDARICKACLSELRDSKNRRYRYPFITCADCGPRYTILSSVPFDRENTTMRKFQMCRECTAEYEDPADRRFHAQTISCSICGPRLELRGPVGTTTGSDALEQGINILRQGGILALKGVGGFQILARADIERSVQKLRQLKQREAKPLAVMVSDSSAAQAVAVFDENSLRALESVSGPIVLVPRRIEADIASGVSPESKLLGVMLPSSGLHQLIAGELSMPVVCTSANISDETILSEGQELKVSQMVDAVLTHNRRIERHADDSVGRVIGGQFRLIRRARGFAPRPIWLEDDAPTVLGVGAELKNTISLVTGRQSFTSVHVGDLGSLSAQTTFEKMIKDALYLYSSRPQIIVCDMHPGYTSTRYALGQGIAPVLRVQHHHAHVASCIAEHQFKGAVLGVACDGLGWGPDGTAWGGELLLVEGLKVKRVGHLRTVPMPGGVSAIREPWRMAVALLDDAGLLAESFRHFERTEEEVKRVAALSATPGQIRTSSVGRLFEGLAALVLGREVNRYEGQLAAALEQHCVEDDSEYAFEIRQEKYVEMDFRPLINDVVTALSRSVDTEVVASAIHNTVVNGLAKAVEIASRQYSFDAVALTGGVFQNVRLAAKLEQRLSEVGFRVLSHRQVPTNDGGISLGQGHLGRLVLQSGHDLSSAIHSEW